MSDGPGAGRAPIDTRTTGNNSAARAEWFARHFDRLAANVGQVIRGKEAVIRLSLVCMMSEGHVLIEDVPGVGKTTLAKALAQSIAGDVKRIQFTPDLLPSDITGIEVYNAATNEFDFHPGGVFAHIVVADEINRASPKTQSALLEVMEERKVTVSGESLQMRRPFLVLATQNSVEFEGTYRLPEAQIDRFMMKLSIGYPDPASEAEVVLGRAEGRELAFEAQPVMSVEDVGTMIAVARETYVAPVLAAYIVTLCSATRKLEDVRLGVSPRGAIALALAAQAYAMSEGRDHVVPSDVKAMAQATLAHRIILNPEAEVRGVESMELIAQVLASVRVPQEPARI